MSQKRLLLLLLVSFGFVFSHWGAWKIGELAFGLNHTVFWIAFIVLMMSVGELSEKNSWRWFAPIGLVVLSFSIFEAPWLKLISLLLLPVMFALVLVFRRLEDPDGQYWNLTLVKALMQRAAAPTNQMDEASNLMSSSVASLTKAGNFSIARRAMSGVTILVPLALLALWLLGSADDEFAEFSNRFFSGFLNLISFEIATKFVVSLGVAVVFLACYLGWGSNEKSFQSKFSTRAVDELIVTIVLAGMLLIYLAFIWFQRDLLTLTELPVEFRETEHIVKSGFWQLFALSIVNALTFYFCYYRVTGLTLFLLRAFVFAAGLILLSGAWRMGLYVFLYGLSYEKFFASFTALFSLLVFVKLVVASWVSQRQDSFKFIMLSFLWAYGVVTLLPIEKIIVHSNLTLAKYEQSRVNTFYLSALSIDVFTDLVSMANEDEANAEQWKKWQLTRVSTCNRSWYEFNLSRWVNCRHPQAKTLKDSSQISSKAWCDANRSSVCSVRRSRQTEIVRE